VVKVLKSYWAVLSPIKKSHQDTITLRVEAQFEERERKKKSLKSQLESTKFVALTTENRLTKS